MNTHGLPNGVAADMADEVACFAWANYLAHAKCGMGISIDIEGKELRLRSVFAPLYGTMDVRVNLDGSDFCDCSEQSPLMVTVDECRALVNGPPQWRVTWHTHARELAAKAAEAWAATAS